MTRRVAREEKTRPDKNRYIVYEILVCSFSLDSICGENDDEGFFGLEQLLNNALGEEGHSKITALIEQLKKSVNVCHWISWMWKEYWNHGDTMILL